MRQLLVECSDPGLVISVDEELENVLVNIGFERALDLHRQLGQLAAELGPDTAASWRGFRLEQPNDGGLPPSFGSREGGEQDRPALEGLLHQAADRGLGQFELRWTMLLPQDGPAPETREQYVSDLADAIRLAPWRDSPIRMLPIELPQSMAAYRERLIEEHLHALLRSRARFPTTGDEWVQDCVERVRAALAELGVRAEAVMEYELGRLDPSAVDVDERVRWAALAVRLGVAFEKWCAAAEEPLPFLYQRAALLWNLWQSCRGRGCARLFLEGQLDAVIDEADGVYTADAVAALRCIRDDLVRPAWAAVAPIRAERQVETADDAAQ
jgi:hypothetical protein